MMETDTPSSSQTIKVIQTVKKKCILTWQKVRKEKKKRRKGREKDEEGRKGEGEKKRREERIKCKKVKKKTGEEWDSVNLSLADNPRKLRK